MYVWGVKISTPTVAITANIQQSHMTDFNHSMKKSQKSAILAFRFLKKPHFIIGNF